MPSIRSRMRQGLLAFAVAGVASLFAMPGSASAQELVCAYPPGSEKICVEGLDDDVSTDPRGTQKLINDTQTFGKAIYDATVEIAEEAYGNAQNETGKLLVLVNDLAQRIRDYYCEQFGPGAPGCS